jgi:hypothetical protein
VWAYFTKVREHTTDGKGRKGYVCVCTIEPKAVGSPDEIIYVDSTRPIWKNLEKYYTHVYEKVSANKERLEGSTYAFDDPLNWESTASC